MKGGGHWKEGEDKQKKLDAVPVQYFLLKLFIYNTCLLLLFVCLQYCCCDTVLIYCDFHLVFVHSCLFIVLVYFSCLYGRVVIVFCLLLWVINHNDCFCSP